jgi:ABC-type branched-subunit amino acid transport system permease subunit
VSLFSFCFNDLYIGESGVLKYSTTVVWGSMCVLSFSKVSFMNLGAVAFGA